MMTLLGSLIGIIARLVPEFIKFFDAKNDRKHELDMQDKALEFQKLKGFQKLDEITTAGQLKYEAESLNVLTEAIRGQDAPSGVKWIDGFSKLMRPLITLQWVILLYPSVVIMSFIVLLTQNVPLITALGTVWGQDEKSLVAGIVNFWFLDRILKRYQK
jgi:hypothetical protein